jgi:hypothetical protein
MAEDGADDFREETEAEMPSDDRPPPPSVAEEALAAAEPASPSDWPAPLILPARRAAPPGLDEADIERQRAFADLTGRKGHYAHKGHWSFFLMSMMAAMILFQSIVIALVGADIWDFEGYDWLLPALLVQNLAQIAGLCLIVVKALFRDPE